MVLDNQFMYCDNNFEMQLFNNKSKSKYQSTSLTCMYLTRYLFS